jgi:hypothetical protein
MGGNERSSEQETDDVTNVSVEGVMKGLGGPDEDPR